MEKDLDKELYNKYLNGEKEAFELLYNKYKNKIQYFIFNIVKDYEKAEDITQDVFIYVLKNKIKEGYSFKNYIYLIARSRAISYKNTEEKRSEITEKYLSNKDKEIEKDVLEMVTKRESKKELLEAINMLNDKYKNAVYLVKIEELSYKEVAKILGKSVQNVKNLVHRGKNELRKILIKKGFKEMNKVSKVLIIMICTIVTISGIAYAARSIYKKYNQVKFNPTYQGTIDEKTKNNLWAGTFDLVWKELEEILGRKIELEENVEMANQLNESEFSKKMLSKEDYQIEVKEENDGGYNIIATLNKDLNFLVPFSNLSDAESRSFGHGEEYVKWFGINNAGEEKLRQNVEILFYNKPSNLQWFDTYGKNEQNNSKYDNTFAVKLKTKEGDEIIIYRTDDKKTFKEYYNDIKIKTNKYNGKKKLQKNEEVIIPFVKVDGTVSYDELKGKTIKNTNGMYISTAAQNVKFNLNEKGCNLYSEAEIVSTYLAEGDRIFLFDDTFIIFMKEKDSDNPYFALKVDNDDILVKKEKLK
ncbi:MAG: RNA polymerase sigma factor [Clostridia bacterium]|jgi:RNA polymerase sigma factor (sigma-70 family)|nr:RNA polymerase sigma factor [Clostridia bacterium]